MARPADAPTRASAVVALLLLAPVPTVGALAALHAVPGAAGRVVFLAAKLWLLLFPAVWYITVERGRPGWSPPERRGLVAGAAAGVAMAAAVLVAWWGALEGQVDPQLVRHAAVEMGIGSPASYFAGAASWILVNSLVEEVVWRWFVLRQLRALLPRVPAILGSAALFTVHHAVAMSDYLSPAHVALGSLAVLAAGVCWAWLYVRYASIWPAWISHVVVDVAVFLIGWQLLFSGTLFDG